MEEYLRKNFDVEPKRPSDEALMRWRSAVAVVKNPTRRFRMVADLAKRAEDERKRKNLQVRLNISIVIIIIVVRTISLISCYVNCMLLCFGFKSLIKKMEGMYEMHALIFLLRCFSEIFSEAKHA